MAVCISEKKRQEYLFPNFARLHVLIKLYPIRRFFRRAVALLFPKRIPEHRPAQCNISENFEGQFQHFKEHGWAFVENIFPKNFYDQIIEDWPSFYYFNPIKSIYKSYDAAFINADEVLERHPSLMMLQSYLESSELQDRLQKFTESKFKEKKFDPIRVCRAYWQSSCIPHLDTASITATNKNESINIIFFVLGTGGSRSGGTCIMRDNEDDIEFEPKNLSNTCLIYRSDQIFHGFPPMRWGTYRWMISCHPQVLD